MIGLKRQVLQGRTWRGCGMSEGSVSVKSLIIKLFKRQPAAMLHKDLSMAHRVFRRPAHPVR
jgi:hypothetical protein